MIDSVFSISFESARGTDAPANSSGAVLGPLCDYVGDAANSLARHAADSVFIAPPIYNPLIFSGPTGVGKTHLALGLTRLWQDQHPKSRAISTNGADFSRIYRAAYEADAVPGFRKKMRSAGLFFLDNLEQLSPKNSVQYELLATLDALLESETQIIVATRSLPAELTELSPAIASRLMAGLTVPLGAPGPAARRAILRRLADMHNLRLADDAIEMLADELLPPVRHLLTVPLLNNAIAQLAVEAGQRRSLGAASVRQLLADNHLQNLPTLRGITATVCQYFHLRAGDVRGPQRRSQIVRARGIAMFLARQITGKSYQEIGKYFSGRDHSTVMNACQRVEKLSQSDRTVRVAITEIHQQLASGEQKHESRSS